MNRFVVEFGLKGQEREYPTMVEAFSSGKVPHRTHAAPHGHPRVVVVDEEGKRYPVLRP